MQFEASVHLVVVTLIFDFGGTRKVAQWATRRENENRYAHSQCVQPIFPVNFRALTHEYVSNSIMMTKKVNSNCCTENMYVIKRTEG